MAAEKGMFVKFMSAFKKHLKLQYPFVKQLEKSLDVSIPKSSSFYLGLSPRYNKHVIINFLHESKPWRIGQFSIYIHISTQYQLTENFSPWSENFESFCDGLYYAPPLLIGKGKYWCLKPTTRSDDGYTIYWKPSSYDSDEVVIKEAIADVCVLLEQLFNKAGFMNY
jgi:hypothetical protein